jgi:hypothetical protein
MRLAAQCPTEPIPFTREEYEQIGFVEDAITEDDIDDFAFENDAVSEDVFEQVFGQPA